MRGRWWFAAVRPQGKRDGVWALPKGIVDRGETPAEDGAARGLRGDRSAADGSDRKLGDVRYVYTWDGERVFKVVSFFLAHARRRSHRRAARREWRSRSPRRAGSRSPTRPALLAYKGEREMAAKAAETLADDPL